MTRANHKHLEHNTAKLSLSKELLETWDTIFRPAFHQARQAEQELHGVVGSGGECRHKRWQSQHIWSERKQGSRNHCQTENNAGNKGGAALETELVSFSAWNAATNTLTVIISFESKFQASKATVKMTTESPEDGGNYMHRRSQKQATIKLLNVDGWEVILKN